ncbi:MAG: hypothetical protein K8I27_14310 [Planctomycetes bacterium]|nr:hypothetical protein [Planctomycetota bacterium]
MPRLAVLTIALLLSVPLFAQDNAKVDKLIGDLASDDWGTRERASRQLVGIGDDAKPGLRAALGHDDPEVRVRASNALITIGEDFAYAVECAIAESEHLNDHGRAALFNLFRIDDPKILRELNQREMQPMWRGWSEQVSIMAPPVIAMARVQALSGVRILVADDARKSFQRVMETPMANIVLNGEVEQVVFLRDALQRFFQVSLGAVPPDEQLLPRPLRIGRTNFLYITTGGGAGGLARRCGDQLIGDLLKGGDDAVRAAVLLAEGASTDSKTADSIREQFVNKPELARLMWLAIALGADDAVNDAVRKRQHEDALTLLKSRDWTVMEQGARYLACLSDEARGYVLSPVIAESGDTLELMSAIWIARGAKLEAVARARVGTLVSSKDDVLAATSARWFAGAEDVTDAELETIWQAGEFQPLDSAFFEAALELVRRPDVADRLVDNARKSLAGIFDVKVSRHALAASVLIGRATADDLAIALDKLTGARNAPRLADQMAELFRGCKTLTQAGMEKFQQRLFDSDANVRRVYMEALRRCDKSLQPEVARGAVDRKRGEFEPAELPKQFQAPRLSLMGILAGTGDMEALDELTKAVAGDDAELAKAAGAAYADAFAGNALFAALEELNSNQDATHAGLAALEGYMEICRRAARAKDRVLFRKAYGVAINMQLLNQNWNLRQELMQMQGGISSGDTGAKKVRPLPKDPALKQLKVE